MLQMFNGIDVDRKMQHLYVRDTHVTTTQSSYLGSTKLLFWPSGSRFDSLSVMLIVPS